MAFSSAERCRRWKRRHPERARACQRALDAKPHRKAAKKRRYHERTAFVLQYKSNHPCIDCGEDDPIVLDLDHRDPKQKLFNIGTYGEGRSMKLLLEEIAKCDVRCANCHRRKSKREWGKYRGR